MWLLKSLSYFLVWFPVLAFLILFGFLLARRLYRELPMFFIYVLYALLLGAARYIAFSLSRGLYFYLYWISELAGVVVVSLALYEVLLRRMFSHFHKVRLYRGIFAIIAMAILCLTILTALEAPDKGKAFLMASRAYDFARTAALVFMISLMAFMGRKWTRYDLGIVLGFAIQAATALLNAAIRTKLHYQPTVMDTVEAITLNLSCFIWLVTFSKAESPLLVLTPDQLNTNMLNQAQTWEKMLKTWLTRKSKQKSAGQQD